MKSCKAAKLWSSRSILGTLLSGPILCFFLSVFSRHCSSFKTYSKCALHLLGSECLRCMLLILFWKRAELSHIMLSDWKQETGTGRILWWIAIMNKALGDCRRQGVKGRRFSEEQTGIVLSAENQAATPPLRVLALPALKLGAPPTPPHPVGKAWRDASRTGWGEDLCGEMVLVVVIGALCWHPGRKVCWGDNMP